MKLEDPSLTSTALSAKATSTEALDPLKAKKTCRGSACSRRVLDSGSCDRELNPAVFDLPHHGVRARAF